MKSIKAKKKFSLSGIFYDVGDEVKVETIRQLIKLNEQGYIEPFSAKEIQDYKVELEKKEKSNKTNEKKEG